MTWMLVSFFAYMIFILVVGVLAGRRTRGTMESFYLGDRKVGAWVTAISASASSESGWLVLGCVGMGYVWGVTAYWITVGCMLGFAFNWLYFAERLRKASAEHGAITIPELLEKATGDRTRLIRLIGVLIIFVLMFTYVAAQLTAAGIALRSMFGWEYAVGVLIGAAITVFYTTVGGYRAVSWTDLFQGLLMVTALVAIPVMAFVSVGGVSGLREKVQGEEARTVYVFQGTVQGEFETVRVEKGRGWGVEGAGQTDGAEPHGLYIEVVEAAGEERLALRLDGQEIDFEGTADKPVVDLALVGLDGSLTMDKKSALVSGEDLFSTAGGMGGLALLGWIIGMLGIGLGFPGSPHILCRFMAAESPKEIARGRVIALVWGVLALGGAVSMGVLARGLLPDIADPQTALLEGARLLLHPALVGLILAAVFAAIRSTADSQLLVASSAVVRDLYGRVLGRAMTDQKAMAISRAVVLILGLLAVGLALTENRLIFWFVLFSWAGLGASFAPALILAVSWKRLSAAGVIASMLTGFGVTLLWKLRIREAITGTGGPDIYELVPAFILSFLAAVVFSFLMPRRS